MSKTLFYHIESPSPEGHRLRKNRRFFIKCRRHFFTFVLECGLFCKKRRRAGTGLLEGVERRKKILGILHEESAPVSGTGLARMLGVSRQVIVQDIALLRATDKNILSTNKGYLLFDAGQGMGRKRRAFKVKHQDEEILDELNTIVDFGGKVRDVVVEHGI